MAEMASESPIPTTESVPATSSTITDEQWEGMQNVLSNIYDFRLPDGHDPSKLFHRKVNKRMVPDYYDVIKEPMAMSTIKQKLNTKEYKNIPQFVRDWALISHNAQVYNRPDSGAYQDALVLKDAVQKELAKLVTTTAITEDESKYPFLGEIPPQEDIVMEDVAEEEDGEVEGSDQEEDDDDEDDELDDSDDDGARRKKRRGPRGANATKRDRKLKDDEDEGDGRKRRGRPPRVDTPMEARIKEILKSLRKFKDANNSLMIYNFERLPDKTAMPEYYAEIKNPIALDVIKKKLKRKKYTNIESFMRDLELLFENAKSYNTDESQVYQDAVFLQKEARKSAADVGKKPDTDYVMEDGRIPMPDGILHNGELWKVGDWVHLQNANDLTKPVVAQLYRTWQDTDGNKWVNACWYYRPEQTVHRFDRHFYENEVVKTGQYRDHPIDEVVDRCFVMFFTRFNKGRPRNFPVDKEIYVCEARYNEEKHKLNKIKTWASCLPDEVRDKDYEMDLFDAPKKMRKIPSPIKHLYKEDEQKETDSVPKPVWGAPNAPPKIGAVHCRPRDPKDSPPPEPTPSPPPAPPPAPIRSISNIASHSGVNGYTPNHRPSDITIPRVNSSNSLAPTPSHSHHTLQTPSHTTHFNQPAPSPVPMLQPMPPSASVYRPTATPLTPSAPQPLQYQNTYASGPTGYRPTPTAAAHSAPSAPSLPHQSSTTSSSANRYEAKPDPDVYFLPDAANNSIPADVRRQFQCDPFGRLLFFTAPPVEVVHNQTEACSGGTSTRKLIGHTAAYLAKKAERQAKLAERKRMASESEEAVRDVKKARTSVGEVNMDIDVGAMVERANEVLAEGVVGSYKSLFGNDGWRDAVDRDMKVIGQQWIAGEARSD